MYISKRHKISALGAVESMGSTSSPFHWCPTLTLTLKQKNLPMQALRLLWTAEAAARKLITFFHSMKCSGALMCEEMSTEEQKKWELLPIHFVQIHAKMKAKFDGQAMYTRTSARTLHRRWQAQRELRDVAAGCDQLVFNAFEKRVGVRTPLS